MSELPNVTIHRRVCSEKSENHPYQQRVTVSSPRTVSARQKCPLTGKHLEVFHGKQCWTVSWNRAGTLQQEFSVLWFSAHPLWGLAMCLPCAALSSAIELPTLTSSHVIPTPPCSLESSPSRQAQGSFRKALPPFPPESSTWLSQSLLNGTCHRTIAQTSKNKYQLS